MVDREIVMALNRIASALEAIKRHLRKRNILDGISTPPPEGVSVGADD